MDLMAEEHKKGPVRANVQISQAVILILHLFLF